LAASAVSAFGLTLVDDADAPAALSTLGFSAFIKTLIDDADAPAARATLGASPTIVPLGNLSAAAANSGYPQSGTGGETLRIIRGQTNSSGAIIFGTGFTITKGGAGSGVYTINFTTPFSSTPTVVGSSLTNGSTFSVTTSGQTGSAAPILMNASGVVADSGFTFIAIGPP
jgi:hypothetical protein